MAPRRVPWLDNIIGLYCLYCSNAFRCGLFFPDPNDTSEAKTALPILNLYIFNATFEATVECEAGAPNITRYNKFCAGIVSI
jgi:hypothetical protein